jgi:hypothetical protein
MVLSGFGEILERSCLLPAACCLMDTAYPYSYLIVLTCCLKGRSTDKGFERERYIVIGGTIRRKVSNPSKDLQVYLPPFWPWVLFYDTCERV